MRLPDQEEAVGELGSGRRRRRRSVLLSSLLLLRAGGREVLPQPAAGGRRRRLSVLAFAASSFPGEAAVRGLAAAPPFLVLGLSLGALELDEGRGGRPGGMERVERVFLFFERSKGGEEENFFKKELLKLMETVSTLLLLSLSPERVKPQAHELRRGIEEDRRLLILRLGARGGLWLRGDAAEAAARSPPAMLCRRFLCRELAGVVVGGSILALCLCACCCSASPNCFGEHAPHLCLPSSAVASREERRAGWRE